MGLKKSDVAPFWKKFREVDMDGGICCRCDYLVNVPPLAPTRVPAPQLSQHTPPPLGPIIPLVTSCFLNWSVGGFLPSRNGKTQYRRNMVNAKGEETHRIHSKLGSWIISRTKNWDGDVLLIKTDSNFRVGKASIHGHGLGWQRAGLQTRKKNIPFEGLSRGVVSCEGRGHTAHDLISSDIWTFWPRSALQLSFPEFFVGMWNYLAAGAARNCRYHCLHNIFLSQLCLWC